jgi:hypothetical protein
MSKANSKFDLDLRFGQAGENWLKWLGGTNVKIEVKTERDLWEKTGNAVFEFRSRGKASALAVTESQWWVHLFSKNGVVVGGMIFSTFQLRSFMRKVYKSPFQYGARICTGGDGNLSDHILCPISQLWRVQMEPRDPNAVEMDKPF